MKLETEIRPFHWDSGHCAATSTAYGQHLKPRQVQLNQNLYIAVVQSMISLLLLATHLKGG